jgi:acetyltransferase-like isoleucine patch superfamily enzyme
MTSLCHFLATSDHPVVRRVRGVRRAILDFTLPAPWLLVKPMFWSFLGMRSIYYFGMRVLVCEPLFKAYCRRYGRRVRTGVFIHWVQGKGDIIRGDDVMLDGKSSFSFATHFTPRPTLIVGDRSSIGHNSRLSVGKQITIGRDCMIAPVVWMLDWNGHPTAPEARLAGLAPSADEVRPVVIEDNVWIGSRSIILPGVSIG